jgi:hypothetical protein
MKGLKLGLVIMAAALLTIGLSGMAYAFHSGGVAECGGCHSMHSPKAGASSLLIGIDPSSTCLTCHMQVGLLTPSSYHVMTADADMPAGTAPRQRTPGGDFGWLKKTYTFTVRGTANTEDGATHGHNIIAADYGYTVDPTNATAPGNGTSGGFQSNQLACNSCHDQHGQFRRLNDGSIAKTGAPIIASGSYATSTTVGYAEPAAVGTALGVYRLLAGNGYSTRNSGIIGFGGVPAAKAPNTYNQSEATNQVRVAYGVKTSGGHVTWSNWCSTCHPGMHSTGNTVHPVDTGLGATIATNYKNYVKSGEMITGGANGFTSLVPFAENQGDYAVLATHASNNNSVLTGPGDSDQVNCMSCHRAHASGFPDMLRWNMENEFMVKNSIYQTTERGRTTTQEAEAGYYDRPATPTFATYQRVLCNKCHAKD